MKIMFLLISFVLLQCSTYAGEENYPKNLRIFDRASFTSATYYSEMFSENMVRTNFKASGKPLTRSSLSGSKAYITDCPTSCSEIIANCVWSPAANKIKFSDLKVQKCIRVDYKESSLYVVQFEYKITLNNATCSNSEPDSPVVWIGLAKKNNLEEEFFSYSDLLCGPEREGYEQIRLEGVADIDKDGKHEIVFDDELYAGRVYIVFKYENGRLKRETFMGIHGTSFRCCRHEIPLHSLFSGKGGVESGFDLFEGAGFDQFAVDAGVGAGAAFFKAEQPDSVPGKCIGMFLPLRFIRCCGCLLILQTRYKKKM